MSDTEGTTPAEQPAAPSTEEQPTEPESQPEPQAPEQAEQAPQEGGGDEPAPAEQEKQEEAPAEGGEQPEQQEAAEQPAAEGEGGEGEGEGEKKEGEEGEGEGEKKEEEGEGKAEEGEAEQEKEEPIVITPEGSKYWLSTEDVLAKGVPENEVENFKTFFYKHGHSIQSWYEQLKDHTHQTEFITLSKEEIEALSAEGDPSEEQQQVLNGLKDRINGAIELYGEDGAMVRIGGRSAKDAVLERDEESFIAEVRDDVINNLEVEKQSANAYAIWKDEKHPGAFRRGLTKIRQSFRRQRPAAAQKEKPKLEEEEKKEGEEAPKAEEAGEGGEAPKPEGEGEEQPKEDGEAAGGAEVTVEVDIEEGAADKGEEKPAEEQAAAAEPPAEEPTPAEPEPAEEGEKKEEGEGEGEGEKPAAEGEGEGEKKEGGEDGEIQKVEEGEGEKKEGEGEGEKKEGEEESQPKSKRTGSHKKKSGEAHHHHYPKSKHDNLDNQIMRAFLKSVGARYKVANGDEALQMLRKSGQIRRDLNQLKPFCGIEGVQFSMSVTKWDSQIPQHPGMDVRGFVYGNELRALSQYNDSAYFPNVDHYKQTIQIKVENFFKEHLQESLKELENYVIDFFVSPEKIYVVRLNPFYTGTGACLFTWTEHAKVLTRGPLEFRIVTASKTAPEAYSSLQPFWTTMLESVLQKKKDEQRQSSSRGCVIL